MSMLKKDSDSEVAKNQTWRESIRRENMALRMHKPVYSCNLRALNKERTIDKPGARKEVRMTLTKEQDDEASLILQQYGHKTKVEDAFQIRVPRTANSAYGLFHAYALEDPRRELNVKKSCEETKFGQQIFSK